MIKVSKRLEGIGEYYFSQKLAEIAEMNKHGVPVLNLGIGSPDLPPHPEVIKVLQSEAARPNVHGYQGYKGVEAFRNAVAAWYQTWYGVTLNPATEILPLLGSKEGIMHICMTYLSDDDVALIPNPGYPTYSSAVKLAGGIPITYDLIEENDWLINFDALEKTDLRKVKLMWVNYPQMPTGQLPTQAFFQALVAFGKKHGILICHDNPYSFILNEEPMSLLSIEGAKDVVLELNSLSKSQNMAGWRVGMLCGNKERVSEVLIFKSNMDSGMFLPVQLAAAKALSLGKQWYDDVNSIYRQRRNKVYELLDLLECQYSNKQVGLFVWAKIPGKYKNGFEMSDNILYNARVFITPGGIFGSSGDEYVRVSLCSSEERLEESIQRIKSNLN